MRILQIIYFSLLLFLLNSCVSLFPQAKKQSQLIGLSPTPITKGKTQNNKVFIDLPSTLKLYKKNDIVIFKNNSFTFVEDYQWADSLPNLLKQFLLESIENIFQISNNQNSIEFDYKVNIEIRKFYIHPPDSIVVSLHVTIEYKGKLWKTKQFDYHLPSEHSMIHYGHAFELALNQFVLDLINLF